MNQLGLTGDQFEESCFEVNRSNTQSFQNAKPGINIMDNFLSQQMESSEYVQSPNPNSKASSTKNENMLGNLLPPNNKAESDEKIMSENEIYSSKMDADSNVSGGILDNQLAEESVLLEDDKLIDQLASLNYNKESGLTGNSGDKASLNALMGMGGSDSFGTQIQSSIIGQPGLGLNQQLQSSDVFEEETIEKNHKLDSEVVPGFSQFMPGGMGIDFNDRSCIPTAPNIPEPDAKPQQNESTGLSNFLPSGMGYDRSVIQAQAQAPSQQQPQAQQFQASCGGGLSDFLPSAFGMNYDRSTIVSNPEPPQYQAYNKPQQNESTGLSNFLPSGMGYDRSVIQAQVQGPSQQQQQAQQQPQAQQFQAFSGGGLSDFLPSAFGMNNDRSVITNQVMNSVQMPKEVESTGLSNFLPNGMNYDRSEIMIVNQSNAGLSTNLDKNSGLEKFAPSKNFNRAITRIQVDKDVQNQKNQRPTLEDDDTPIKPNNNTETKSVQFKEMGKQNTFGGLEGNMYEDSFIENERDMEVNNQTANFPMLSDTDDIMKMMNLNGGQTGPLFLGTNEDINQIDQKNMDNVTAIALRGLIANSKKNNGKSVDVFDSEQILNQDSANTQNYGVTSIQNQLPKFGQTSIQDELPNSFDTSGFGKILPQGTMVESDMTHIGLSDTNNVSF